MNDYFLQKELNKIVVKNMETIFLLKNLKTNSNIKHKFKKSLETIEYNSIENIELMESIGDFDVL